MKRQIVGPVLGKLVHQFPEVVTLAYDLRLTRRIARYKDLSEKYNFLNGQHKSISSTHVAPGFPKKHRLGPQNGSGSSGPEKLLKIVNCATTRN